MRHVLDAQETWVELLCPWCCAPVGFFLEPGVGGEFTEDCEVCCRPWRIQVSEGEDGLGNRQVSVERE